MTTITIRTNMTREEVRRAVAAIPQGLVGGGAGADAVLTRTALALLGRIKTAFVQKARGGADESGLRWPPLKASTIARRRRGRGAGHTEGAGVEVLRDTGLLLNSLSPGTYSREQIVRVGRAEVVVGTNRKGAAAHHSGAPRRNLPQRRLWPAPEDWPDSWWEDILDQARDGIVDHIAREVGGGA